jgi:hypothetical protein
MDAIPYIAMPHIAIGVRAFAWIFGGGVLGLAVGRLIPKAYTTEESRYLVQAIMNTVAILSALVLGLLIATAQRNFDARNRSIEQFAANLQLLDHEIKNFSPQISGIRDQLRRYTGQQILLLWPESNAKDHSINGDRQDSRSLEDIVQKVREFTPASEAQRLVKASALKIAGDLATTHWTLAVQEGSEIPSAFINVLLFWLTVLFIHFGIFAQRNALAIMMIFVCALSLASAIYVIMDFNEPAGGFISVSPKPMQNALAQMAG